MTASRTITQRTIASRTISAGLRWTIGFLAAVAVAAGCGETKTGSGSNSNWLRSCSDDTVCSADQTCQCGVCTIPCNVDRECKGLDAHASCASASPAACGTSSPPSICVLPCTSDAECETRQGLSCQAFACAPDRSNSEGEGGTGNRAGSSGNAAGSSSASSSGAGGNGAGSNGVGSSGNGAGRSGNGAGSTDAGGTDAGGTDAGGSAQFPNAGAGSTASGEAGESQCASGRIEIAKAIGEAVRAADTGCTVDEDCVGVSLVTGCFATCGVAAVARTARDDVAGAIAQAAEEACAPYRAAGCPNDVPPPCAGPFVTCNAGKCEAEAGTCDTRRATLVEQVQAAISAAPATCTTDADCVWAGTYTGCSDNCEAGPISRSSSDAVQSQLNEIGAGLCPAFYATGCQFSVPPCVPPQAIACRDGICQTD